MFEVTTSPRNKDGIYNKDQYLAMLENWSSRYPMPELKTIRFKDKRFRLLDFGHPDYITLKQRGAEAYFADFPTGTTFGYAAPRFGHAAMAIAAVCNDIGHRAVFFAPASKKITGHQAIVRTYDADLRFARIPAMPTLNAWIKKWAKDKGYIHLPMGLMDVPMVTANLVWWFDQYSQKYGEPEQAWCAVSTGTMLRAMLIAWPECDVQGVAVARNIKEGEKGRARIVSYKREFYKQADVTPPFSTTLNYDAKAYEHMLRHGRDGALFVNVGSDGFIFSRLRGSLPHWQQIDGSREWGDKSAFEEN